MTTGKPGMRTVIPLKGRVGKNLRERKNTVCHLKTISLKSFSEEMLTNILIIIIFDNIIQ